MKQMTRITNGQRVRVYPEAQPEKAATGTVVLAAENGNSLAISFGEQYVPFMTGATGMALHSEHGKMLLVHREASLWNDVFQGGYFEIEEV